MKSKLLIACAVLCLVTGIRAQVGLSSDEQKLFDLVNQERRKIGLQPLQWDYHLAEAAQGHSEQMASHRLLTHQAPGEPPLLERVGATAIRFDIAAENVAAGDMGGNDTIARVHRGLMNSPEHRRNILDPKNNALGIAIVVRGGQIFVTQDFAHTLPVYSEEQFRDNVVAAFNKARRGYGLAAVVLRDDPRIHAMTCAEGDKPQIPPGLANALETVVFTSSRPEDLPVNMQKAAGDNSLHRLSIGTCFHPDKDHGFASFWVVAAFY